MSKVYGYCRISTKKQSIDRQIRNITTAYPDAIIFQEAYTGTKMDREQWGKLLKRVKQDLSKGEKVTIVFDSVSRMSRNAEDGIATYMDLFNEGVELIFMKERYIDTATYREAMSKGLAMTGTEVDFVLEGINKYLQVLAKKQIELAFEQAQKEVDDLRQRTKEGLRTAVLNGVELGHKEGTKLTTKKSVEMKAKIRKMAKDFDGNMTDKEVIETLGLARNTFYKYKKEMLEEN